MNERERGGGKWGGVGRGEAGSQVGRQANRLYPDRQADGQAV